jgi:hypothetical protein
VSLFGDREPEEEAVAAMDGAGCLHGEELSFAYCGCKVAVVVAHVVRREFEHACCLARNKQSVTIFYAFHSLNVELCNTDVFEEIGKD